MTRVKICGITRMEDALHATACGAEMLGFNFYPKSPRYISPQAAREIIVALPKSIECVGVFVNEATPDHVRQMADQAGLSAVQLHGDETPEFCSALADLSVIKALRVSNDFDLRELVRFHDCRILLDAASAGFGGSGSRFDWEIARRVREQVTFLLLAGGLDAESVGDAIRTVSPDVVDACSLLESAPGIKDSTKVARFIANAHAQRIRLATQSRE